MLYLPPEKAKDYKDWCETYLVSEECFEAFRSLSKQGFTRFKDYILNYFNKGCNFTNAATEGLNRKIDKINNVGNGYSFKALRAKALYSPLFEKRTRYTVSLSSIKRWDPRSDFVIGSFSSGVGGRSFTTGMAYVFSEQVEELHFPPLNIYDENDWLEEVFVSKPDHEISEFRIDEESILKAKWPDEDCIASLSPYPTEDDE